ncbi:Putative cargo-transport protein ypp1 [Leucoagaricus sp. SymC.cos]|nr:Putative cargo-transport protein ypp1 [Leucoagaricus sp. SymC.cos]
MSNLKERHYWSQLRAALTAGQWRSTSPAKAPNSIPLSWSELFRKFNKHCRGFKDVAEVASQTQILGSLLAADHDDEDVMGNSVAPPLAAGNECLVPPERADGLLASYDILKGLEPSDSLNFALAYFAYVLGRPQECLDYISHVPDLLMVQSHIPTPDPQHASSASFVSLANPSLPEIRDGRGWAMAETFRSICLQGMSHEKLYPSEPRRTLTTGKLDFAPFYQLREMWRWVERLLWRGIVLSARPCEVHQDETTGATESLWQWFGHYATCSAGWPSNFRTAHRSAVATIYLRAFVLRHRVLSESPVYIPKTPSWLHQARTLCQDYRAILSASTKFPRAGERNIKVEEFVDLCVAVWEAASGMGEHAGWVIEILWWATRYTFNSPRVYRHMTRLFHLAGDTPLAIRTLKLYVQTVGKAYQASKEGVNEDVDSDDHWVQTLVFGIRMLCRHTAASDDPESIEDARYAGTLIAEARSRLSEEKRLLIASVHLAEGVWNSVMALKEGDPYTRPQRLQDAHRCFILSIQVQPTSSGYYHLALSFVRSGPWRDLDKAVESAGLALESDPKEIRYWHLLGLLLTAQEKWKEAAEILERGAELDKEVAGELEGEDDEEEEAEPVATDSTAGTGETQGNAELPSPDTENAYETAYALGETETTIPPASGLVRSILEKNPPSKRDVYEYSLQLRMTQAALTEVVEGPEGAELKWVEVFSWIAEKKGALHSSEQSHRHSMESAVPPSMMDKTFVTSQTQAPLTTVATNAAGEAGVPSLTVQSHDQLIVAPIPITISPATPTENIQNAISPFEEVISEKGGEKEKSKVNGLRVKRSISIDRGDTSKSKKVQQMLKDRVHKGRRGITAVSRKIGHGVSKHHQLHLRRTNSSPDFHEVIRNASYQASSIHSRRRLGSFLQLNDRTPTESPPPPPPPSLPAQPPTSQKELKPGSRQAKENRLLSELWLMSAATFRRLGKIEQAKGAIQEAEVKDEGNPGVWVQLGLYYFALGHRQHAIDALQKALIIDTDDVPATIHLSRIYLTPTCQSSSSSLQAQQQLSSTVDLAAGLLSHLTQGKGWDVPEAWYFLAKAYGMQGRKQKEREALKVALEVSEGRGVRELWSAVGWCI